MTATIAIEAITVRTEISDGMAGPVAARPGEVAEELQVDAADDVDGAGAEELDREQLRDLVGEQDRRRHREGEPPVPK